MEATLQEILDAREQRAAKQKTLLEQYGKTLLCFTMNIPGPEKWSRDVAIGFYLGCWFLEDALRGRKILYKERITKNSGCEAYYVVDIPPRQLKEMVMELEEIDPVGRLFDMDVMTLEEGKISRKDLGHGPRKCLICDNDAAICARTRAHGLDALKNATGFYLYVAAREFLTEYVASRAYFALYQEVSTTPKPGLVDKKNTGAHQDMTIRHFFASANALRDYFAKAVETGFLTRDNAPEETFQKLRPLGKDAEKKMYETTRGVNTHKGAIFSMGLLCAAAGRLSPDRWQVENLLQECAAMCRGVVAKDFDGVTEENAKTAGERLYAKYGITGVRGQAEAGFPAVSKVGLPVLLEGLNKGISFNDACCAVLLHILAATDDTNLIHRSDRETQLQIKDRIAAMLKDTPYPTVEQLDALDEEFIQKNLSPGGSADLLALTLLVYFLRTET